MVHLHNGYHAVVANLLMGIGLQWDHYFTNGRYHLGLNLGWDHQLWFDQNRFMDQNISWTLWEKWGTSA